MAHDSTDLLELVGRLHEGVTNDEMWRRSLDGVLEALDCPALLMGAVGGHGREVRLEFGRKASREAISILEGPLADPRHNPWLRLAATHPLRRPATIADVGGQQALERTRVWTEFYRPFGFGDSIGGVLERQPEYAQVLIVGRHLRQSAFGPADLERFSALMPHIARAWRVKQALAEWEGLAGTLKFALDRLERAVVVTGPDGQIRFANRAADILLSQGNRIDARRGRLRAARSSHDGQLESLIRRATRTGLGADNVAVDAISIRSDEGALAIVAEPLAPPHSDRLGHSAAPGAVLFISDSAASNAPVLERLQVVYGLTPAEARLTSLIVGGHGIGSAATVLGVSANTVKFHLKAVFDKVDVTRQTQLVRRVLADVGGLAEPGKLRPAAG